MDMQIDSLLRGGSFKRLLEEQNAEFQKKYNLKRAELEILYFLSRCGTQDTSTDIHRQLMMNRGHISQAVDSLSRRNYIIAIQDQKDRRYVHYKISEDARELVAELTKRREEMYRRILSGITEEELRVYREVSGKIKNNIEELISEY